MRGGKREKSDLLPKGRLLLSIGRDATVKSQMPFGFQVQAYVYLTCARAVKNEGVKLMQVRFYPIFKGNGNSSGNS